MTNFLKPISITRNFVKSPFSSHRSCITLITASLQHIQTRGTSWNYQLASSGDRTNHPKKKLTPRALTACTVKSAVTRQSKIPNKLPQRTNKYINVKSENCKDDIKNNYYEIFHLLLSKIG